MGEIMGHNILSSQLVLFTYNMYSLTSIDFVAALVKVTKIYNKITNIIIELLKVKNRNNNSNNSSYYYIYGVLGSRQYAQQCLCINSAFKQLFRVGTIIIMPTLQMKKLGTPEVKSEVGELQPAGRSGHTHLLTFGGFHAMLAEQSTCHKGAYGPQTYFVIF